MLLYFEAYLIIDIGGSLGPRLWCCVLSRLKPLLQGTVGFILLKLIPHFLFLGYFISIDGH